MIGKVTHAVANEDFQTISSKHYNFLRLLNDIVIAGEMLFFCIEATR